MDRGHILVNNIFLELRRTDIYAMGNLRGDAMSDDANALAILYRVEDKERRGPYRPGFSQKWVSDRDHPAPFFVELGISPDQIRQLFKPNESGQCGCISMDQLRLWFDCAETRRLKKLGYRIVQVVPKRIIAITDTQVVFVR
jgi:hypothetical protein